MIIRKAGASDADQLKTLYFEHLTHYPPKEEQNMELWAKMIEKFENDNKQNRRQDGRQEKEELKSFAKRPFFEDIISEQNRQKRTENRCK